MKRKVHWTPRAALVYAVCGADSNPWGPYALAMTRNLKHVTCGACRRTKAYRKAAERQEDGR